ncbi:hypothetical protein NPJ82_17850 (plasmid) [Sphingomonas sp. NY01]|uniref:hypothetical protein n=1 Tax=Sphingomonas sp. NY01 TaxID=2968057 RepID=UPI00315DADD7
MNMIPRNIMVFCAIFVADRPTRRDLSKFYYGNEPSGGGVTAYGAVTTLRRALA